MSRSLTIKAELPNWKKECWNFKEKPKQNNFMKKNNKKNWQIFSDKRGESHVNKIGGVEVNVIYSKAGKYRAGDFHAVEQYTLVLKGKLEITTRQKNKDVIKKYGRNDFIVITRNIPHLYKSLTDSVIVQWLAGPYKTSYYEPYRKIINQQLNLCLKKR